MSHTPSSYGLYNSKQETRVVKVTTVKSSSNRTHTKPVRAGNGRLKTTEPTVRGRTSDIKDASQVLIPSVGQSRREKLPVNGSYAIIDRVCGPVMVPVLSSTGKPLMPCYPARARGLEKSGRAIRRWYKGIFCIRLINRNHGNIQQIAVGIDPGSKREAMTVQSKQHTYINTLSDSVTCVKDRMGIRRKKRKARRFRKTPCRAKRFNRTLAKTWVPPSTKSRWQIKLNIIKFLIKIYPITDFVVEDTMVKTKRGFKKWNKFFSPLGSGKSWFYDRVSKLGNLLLFQGYETAQKRKLLGLKKSHNKLIENFESHNVDSWVLSSFVTGKNFVDNTIIFRITQMQLYKRQLHMLEPSKGGIRRRQGGTMSFGIKRGSVVKNVKLGMVYIGGNSKNRVSLHDLSSGRRITKLGSVKNCCFLYHNNWRTKWILNKLPTTKVVGFRKNS